MATFGMGGSFGEDSFAVKGAQHAGIRAKRATYNSMTAMAVLVYEYHPGTQRVDVVDKCNPFSSPIRDLPIAGTGGSLRHIRPMVAANPRSDFAGDKPTAGIVIFPNADATGTWKDNSRRPPASFARNGPEGGVFMPEVATLNDFTLPAGVGSADSAFVDSVTGSTIVFRSNGDIDITAAGKLVINGSTIHVGGLGGAAAARVGDLTDIQDGDAGDGNHAHAIDEGSSKVFIS